MSNQVEDCSKLLWPFQNVQTLFWIWTKTIDFAKNWKNMYIIRKVLKISVKVLFRNT